MELSKRLQAVANLVTAGSRTVDIGTDHAYIPIYLIENKIAPLALAMDINEGPLMRAREHVAENGLSEKIRLRLSDGMKELKPGEADAAVIAGMGGGLVIKILSDSRDVAAGLKECILQPQSEIAKVRAFLLEEGFLFTEEDMVLEDGKFYPMMKVIPPAVFDRTHKTEKEWGQTELIYGKLLLEKRHPVLKQFLERELQIKVELLNGLKKQESERARERIEELEQEIAYVRKGMEYYAL